MIGGYYGTRVEGYRRCPHCGRQLNQHTTFTATTVDGGGTSSTGVTCWPHSSWAVTTYVGIDSPRPRSLKKFWLFHNGGNKRNEGGITPLWHQTPTRKIEEQCLRVPPQKPTAQRLPRRAIPMSSRYISQKSQIL